MLAIGIKCLAVLFFNEYFGVDVLAGCWSSVARHLQIFGGGMAVWLVGFALGATLVEDAANMDFKIRPVSKVR